MIRWAATRPAVVWAFAAGLTIAGGVAFTKLPLATKTTVDLPKIGISAVWQGASPELTETYLTSPIEAAVQGIHGVRKTSSTSSDRGASVQVELDPETDITMARLAILERMETLRRDLPAAAQNTISVSNYVPEELDQQPLLEVNITGPYTPGALQRISKDQVQPRLEALPGIAGIGQNGGATNGVLLSYDPTRLKQLGINPYLLVQAVGQAKVVEALGVTRDGSTERHVSLRDVPHAVEDLERLPVRGPGGQIYALGELAAVHPEEDSRGSFYRMNGQTAVTLSLQRQAGADAIKTAAAARQVLDEIGKTLPPGVHLRVERDESIDLDRELNDLLLRGAIAFASVLLVMMLTLREVGRSFLVLGSAVVAIAGTALGLYLFKIPANLLTLAGLAMGIGILVQNGLVVVERMRLVADTPEARANAGIAIGPAVIGATLTTAVVLFPFLYLQGNARAAFMPFAAAFTLALFWSVITALVLVPAVGKGGGGQKGGWKRLSHAYERTSFHLLRWRWATITLTVAIIGVLTWGFIKKVPRNNWGGYWGGGQRTTVSARVSFPRGSDPEDIERIVSELERVSVGRKGVALVRSQGNGMGGGVLVEFTKEGGLTDIPWVISEEMTQRAVLIGGTENVSVTPPQGPGFNNSSGGSSVNKQVKILGYSFEGVRRVAEDLKARLDRIPRVREVNINSAGWWNRERAVSIALHPDRQALGRIGATAQDYANSVAREVQNASGGTELEISGETVNASVRASGSAFRQLDQLRDGQVFNPNGSPVRISDVSSVDEVEGLSRIERENQQYVRILSYDFRGPQKLADRTHKAFMSSITVPPGYTVNDDQGRWADDDSAKGLWLVFGIGLVLVLLAVALVFDSVWAAGMVFLSLPMALGGVVAAFWITGSAFTREAAVGVILVVGHAVNQSILLIDAVLMSRRRHGGKATGADVLRAMIDRAGMIVIVTLTTTASLIPMAWGTASDTMFGAIALAMAGGMFAGTLGALFLLPAFLLGFRHRKWGRRRKKPPAAPMLEPVTEIPAT